MNCPRCGTTLVEQQVSDIVTRLECPDEDCTPRDRAAALRSLLPGRD